ncbi:MAG: GxxExxY protein [Acidobacteria bacterium]|nr:MAG: GxxExxY protein [Acidobacteriota bacterium]
MDHFSSDRELTQRIIECMITVHQTLGPGFLESVYRRALLIELDHAGLMAQSEQDVTVQYRGEEVGRHRLDIFVEDRVVLELKTVDQLGPIHYAQIRSYLKATKRQTGLLVNFARERADFRRIESSVADA